MHLKVCPVAIAMLCYSVVIYFWYCVVLVLLCRASQLWVCIVLITFHVRHSGHEVCSDHGRLCVWLYVCLAKHSYYCAYFSREAPWDNSQVSTWVVLLWQHTRIQMWNVSECLYLPYCWFSVMFMYVQCASRILNGCDPVDDLPWLWSLFFSVAWQLALLMMTGGVSGMSYTCLLYTSDAADE